MLLRLPNASALFDITMPTVWQSFIAEQSPQVSHPLPSAHCRIGQRLSQKGVLTPSTRQPSQFIISGVISTPFISDQSRATFSRSALSLLSVAVLASQLSQSSPQYAISFFIVCISFFPLNYCLRTIIISFWKQKHKRKSKYQKRHSFMLCLVLFHITELLYGNYCKKRHTFYYAILLDNCL